MKLFSCTNKECKSYVPHDAFTNRVIQRITSDHPMTKEGMVNPDADTEIHNIEYVCGRCRSRVKEVPLRKVMKVDIEKVTNSKVYGKFYNKLRKRPFDFMINKKNGQLKIKGLNPVEVEVDFIMEQYQQIYKKSISVEIMDVVDGVYEVEVRNPHSKEILTLYIEDEKLVESYGEPNEIELDRAILAVQQSHY